MPSNEPGRAKRQARGRGKHPDQEGHLRAGSKDRRRWQRHSELSACAAIYNQWVANQTLEDYALRFTAKRAQVVELARRQHRVRRDLLSGAGSDRRHDHGQLRLHQRAPRPSWWSALIIFLTGLPISYYAATLRRRHGPADARRRLRLYRLDDHLADLRLLHLHLLRPRSGDHVAGAASCVSAFRLPSAT